MTQKDDPRFKIPLPGGRVARVPLSTLEAFVDPEAKLTHTGASSAGHHAGAPEPEARTIVVNLHLGAGRARVDTDVSAHHLVPDGQFGSDYHTDFEQGECVVVDEAGFPVRVFAWHRHPCGTEYAELSR